MTERSYDYLIVGAGIVGLTVAHELKTRFPSARIGVLDKEASAGMHASGRNSGVLHSGIYYSSDTLKARVCAAGARRMMEFAHEHGIPCSKSGKIIVATSERDLPTVDRLLRNAAENGIRAWRIDEKELRELEPFAAAGPAAIYSPDTAVIDSRAVVKRLTVLLEQQGVRILWRHGVRKVGRHGEVVTDQGKLSYGWLFNCAGAYADVVARHFGLAGNYALVPFKGIYWKLRPEAEHLVRASIYPVPDIDLPFLGVHLTRVISGDVYVGPTAIPALGRENYGLIEGIRPLEAASVGYRLAGMYLRNRSNFRALAHIELGKYRKHNFLTAARRLLPSITAEDMIPTPKSGIRPQLINLRDGKLEMDYIFEHSERSTHVLNAISPAFTSSFAFAELIVSSCNAV
ncbi:L-2-hydroxyglutarate oxidase LhgO [Nitrosospira sp. Nl5]|uniref:L-2-hydroxyglutarate oxidase n=1 Tax=Nitrosospira sp. Nl5 TaxID=200120 RepID=UPI0008847865|nr:L-2-hydroxyglutarate oxidase [Nitrosospira sp. Nl5]SCY21320.1 L-2-hydroxyglutarate oxidase LhgO [Nitrosospira sp. Nl5]